MNATFAVARLRRFVQSMAVGGLAVIHHGYARSTEQIDLLVQAGARPPGLLNDVHRFAQTSC